MNIPNKKARLGRRKGGPSESAMGVLRDLLDRRAQRKRKNPQYDFSDDLWTMSSVWYNSLPSLTELVASGRISKLPNRGYYVYMIKEACEDLGYSREDLGIIASERAQLFYRGKVEGVSFEEISQLAEKGVAIICIEKENFGNVFAPFAADCGVAILNSRGFLEDYGAKLVELAYQKGAPIFFLTDYDASGLYIFYSLHANHGVKGRVSISGGTKITRLGIDNRLLQHFNLSAADSTLSVPYNTHDGRAPRGVGSHLLKLESLAKGIPGLAQQIDDVKLKRIELDSVLSKVGARPFWDYVVERMQETNPVYDYTRVIDVDKLDNRPDSSRQVFSAIWKLVDTATYAGREAHKKSLAVHNGLVSNVDQEVAKIVQDLQQMASSDPRLSRVMGRMADVLRDEGISI